MISMSKTFLVLCLCFFPVQGNMDRHMIYWDPVMTPELNSEDYVMKVKIGEFMDILCPQQSLLDITNGPRELSTFDLYNVTEDEFDKCTTGGKKNFVFACDQPERENKLTIKFQLISPSPLGFRFQYCQDYYLLASPREKKTNLSCGKNLTRLRISVACNDEPAKTSTRATTTTTIAPSVNQPSISSTTRNQLRPNKDLTKRLQKHAKASVGHNQNEDKFNTEPNVVVPIIVNPSQATRNKFRSSKRYPRVLVSPSLTTKDTTSSGKSITLAKVSWTILFTFSAFTFIISSLLSNSPSFILGT